MPEQEKVILYGISYYNDCGYICESKTFLATFSNKKLAENYVDDSLIDFDELSSEYCPVCKFSELSLLGDSKYYSIEPYEFVHDPLMTKP